MDNIKTLRQNLMSLAQLARFLASSDKFMWQRS